jgi:OmpA-OmpF porin, OOP family
MFSFFKISSSTVKRIHWLVICAGWLPVQSQTVKQAKSPLMLADQYFAMGEYYTAAHLYEQYLNPPKNNKKDQVFPVYTKKGKPGELKNVSRTAVLYRQAESYRLANYWPQADSTYKKCTDNIDALYWSAVCERSIGKYQEAEMDLRSYLESPNTNKQFAEAAEKEWATLQYIKKQLARPDTALASIRKLRMPGSYEKGSFALVPVSGDQYLISSTKTDSMADAGTNPHNSHLFYASMNNDSLGQLTTLSLPAEGLLNNQGAASVGANGTRIYFTQWQKVNGRTISAIYVIKQNNGSWSAPELLERVNTNRSNSKQPFCTADGKYLFFACDRPGGSGGFDIWYAPIREDGSTDEPVNAGAVINTEGDEQAPFYHTGSKTLVFATNGRQGMGGFDLFTAKGSETTWSPPGNMGHPVNSSRDDIYFFAPEKTTLLGDAVIGSDRGAGCCLETYRITKAPKNNRLTGLVLDCKNRKPVPDADVVLTLPSGQTKHTTTDITGKYSFDTIDIALQDVTIAVSKQTYRDTASAIKITRTDETNLLIDQLFNTEICVDKKFVLRPENVVTVFFDFDKHNLKTEAVRKLDSVYNVLVEFPSFTLQISGYTDGKGSDEYNKKLSDRRARACADYFIAKGIAANRITFESFGACCPLEMELINGRDNPDGRSKNRRALINITKE